jgi:ankyrin repeat protein
MHNDTMARLVAFWCLTWLVSPVRAQKPGGKKPTQPSPTQSAKAQPSKVQSSKAQIQRQLEKALEDSDLAGVKRALARGADPNRLDRSGHLPLTVALMAHDWQSANWLRLKGASIRKAGPEALLYAAENGEAEILRYVIRLGVKPAGLYNWDGSSPLVACAGGLESGTDEDEPLSEDQARDEEERRVLALRVLLEAGERPNQSDKNGQLPLHAAAEMGRAALVKVLLDKGADVNALNRRGFTPLFAATPFPARSMRHKKVRDLLFSRDADVNIGTTTTGLNPFHYAVREGRADLMREFLEHGANVNAPMANGQTPLIIAMIEARVESARLLLDKGADAQPKDKSGKTALDYEKYGLGDTEAQREIDLSNPQTREFFDEAMQGKINAKFWADIRDRRVQIAALIRTKLQTITTPP